MLMMPKLLVAVQAGNEPEVVDSKQHFKMLINLKSLRQFVNLQSLLHQLINLKSLRQFINLKAPSQLINFESPSQGEMRP